MSILEELEWRGLIADCTDRTELEKKTAGPLTLYCGFDPSADSLHVGNLVPLLGLRYRAYNRWENNIVQTAGTAGAQTAFMCVLLAAFDMVKKRIRQSVHDPVKTTQPWCH